MGKETFNLEAKYAKPEQLPGKVNPWIGRFTVKGVKADSKDDFMICKLKARLNLHGILKLRSPFLRTRTQRRRTQMRWIPRKSQRPERSRSKFGRVISLSCLVHHPSMKQLR